MGREVRRVPTDWVHPESVPEGYLPLRSGFASALADWREAELKWAEGLRSDYRGGWKPVKAGEDFGDWVGECPQPEDYMPDWSPDVATHYMMYETTTEGTPISPAFATPEELAHWLAATGASAFADITASYESWLRVANGRKVSGGL